MRTSFWLVAATPLLLLTGCSDAFARAFSEETPAPISIGNDTSALPAVITTDVSAYAGQTVRLQLQTHGHRAPIYAGFDSFTLE